VGFCKRYRISTQARNNTKAHDQADREEAIKAFHRYLHLELQTSAPQTDPVYGRFSPDHMLHVDQVPLPFASPHTRTLNPIGAKSCRIAGSNTSGLDKRQATVQIWICAKAGRQYIKPTIIFRGSRGPRSRLPKAGERALYATLTNIRVAFQKNAWADGIFCSEEIIEVARDIKLAGIEGEVMIGMDNHAAQRTPAMLALYTRLGMVPVFTAANCTDCISPVDHHIGRFIQERMAASFRAAVEADPTNWIMSAEQNIDDPECTQAEARRMLMATWLAAAWTDLIENYPHLIEAAFVKTGFKLALDGSDDRKMEIQGWSNSDPYGFR
jgi:hypothetical protein